MNPLLIKKPSTNLGAPQRPQNEEPDRPKLGPAQRPQNKTPEQKPHPTTGGKKLPPPSEPSEPDLSSSSQDVDSDEERRKKLKGKSKVPEVKVKEENGSNKKKKKKVEKEPEEEEQDNNVEVKDENDKKKPEKHHKKNKKEHKKHKPAQLEEESEEEDKSAEVEAEENHEEEAPPEPVVKKRATRRNSKNGDVKEVKPKEKREKIPGYQFVNDTKYPSVTKENIFSLDPVAYPWVGSYKGRFRLVSLQTSKTDTGLVVVPSLFSEQGKKEVYVTQWDFVELISFLTNIKVDKQKGIPGITVVNSHYQSTHKKAFLLSSISEAFEKLGFDTKATTDEFVKGILSISDKKLDELKLVQFKMVRNPVGISKRKTNASDQNSKSKSRKKEETKKSSKRDDDDDEDGNDEPRNRNTGRLAKSFIDVIHFLDDKNTKNSVKTSESVREFFFDFIDQEV